LAALKGLGGLGADVVAERIMRIHDAIEVLTGTAGSQPESKV
jgi:hypothetical protein